MNGKRRKYVIYQATEGGNPSVDLFGRLFCSRSYRAFMAAVHDHFSVEEGSGIYGAEEDLVRNPFGIQNPNPGSVSYEAPHYFEAMADDGYDFSAFEESLQHWAAKNDVVFRRVGECVWDFEAGGWDDAATKPR